MNKCFHHIFVTVGDHRPLSFHGDLKDGNWFNGQLTTPDGCDYAPVQEGIPSFIVPEDDPWVTEENLAKLFAGHKVDRKTLIPNNWNEIHRNHGPSTRTYKCAESVVAHGGLILEIACGPGGGFMPLMLSIDPKALLLVNDIGLWMLVDWKRYIDERKLGNNVSFAQFDMTKCPIRTDSIDCVDSAGGIGNIPNNDLAFAEIYRILKPGGILFMADCIPDPDSFKKLPKEERQTWIKQFPDSEIGYEMRLTQTGFNILEMEEAGKFALNPTESDLAQISTKYGITMYLKGYYIEAQKRL